MTIPSLIYDLKFTSEELEIIHKLRKLDKRRKIISWSVGFFIFIVVFIFQIPFHGNNIIHAISSYGCLPIGIASGYWLYYKLDKYVESNFINIWDPIYYERSGKTKEQINAEQDVVRLTDNIHFYSLTLNKKKEEVNKIYKSYGLNEPNKL